MLQVDFSAYVIFQLVVIEVPDIDRGLKFDGFPTEKQIAPMKDIVLFDFFSGIQFVFQRNQVGC